MLNKSPRCRAPCVGMGYKAQTAVIAAAMARLGNAADRPKRGCAARERLVQHGLIFLRSSNASQQGFTLLEVLVALVLLGIGVGMGYTAISGSTRLDGKMTAHTAAVALARAKLDEALANPLFALANEKREDRYAGVDFGYRAVLSPLAVLESDKKLLIPGFKSELQRIDIEVFWGPKDAPQSYKLTSYRVAPPASGAAGAAATTTP